MVCRDPAGGQGRHGRGATIGYFVTFPATLDKWANWDDAAFGHESLLQAKVNYVMLVSLASGTIGTQNGSCAT